MAIQIIFWVSLLGVVAIYFGYGIAITIINLFTTKPAIVNLSDDELPTLAVLIAAYNEEACIEEKINNTLSLSYPPNKLSVYVISDGSNDNTNAIVAKYPQVTLLFQPKREGKSACINRGMKFIKESITVFTDANVMINENALRALANRYADKTVGGVSGEKVVMQDDRAKAASTEGLYWKYESYLKRQDALLSSIAGAAGEMFSIRTELFEAIPVDTLLDDFIISLNIIRKGYSVKYEPAAFASEKPSANIMEEYKRKVRIAAGGMQTILRNLVVLNPFQYGVFSFQFLIHRVSRWTIAPILIVAAFIANLFLLNQGSIYVALFIAQLIFNWAALAGWYLSNTNIKVKALHVPFYFQFMHYCVVIGWVRYFKGNQQAAWQKATRLSYN